MTNVTRLRSCQPSRPKCRAMAAETSNSSSVDDCGSDSADGTMLGRGVDALVLSRWRAILAVEGVLRGAPGGVQRVRNLGDGFFAQCSAEHSTKKRATTMSTKAEDIKIVRPFDASLFHFGKAKGIEVMGWLRMPPIGTAEDLLELERAEGAVPTFVENDEEAKSGCSTLDVRPPGVSDEDLHNYHPLVVNPSPMLHGHSLFVPGIGRELPQVLTAGAFYSALRCCSAFKRPDFRMLFNSLGAWASVNHLHFHPIWIDGKFGEDNDGFPIEKCRRDARTKLHVYVSSVLDPESSATLFGLPAIDEIAEVGVDEYREDHRTCASAEVFVYDVAGWPMRALMFSSNKQPSRGRRAPSVAQLASLAAVIGRFTQQLHERSIAYNLLVLHRGASVIVVPRSIQRPGGALGGALHIASAEVMGLGQFYDEDVFESTTAVQYKEEMASYSISKDELDAVLKDTTRAS